MRRLLALCCLALVVPAFVYAQPNPVVAASKRTAAARSATFDMSVTTKVGRERMVMTGSGAQKGSEAKMTMRMRAAGATIRFDAILVNEQGGYVMYMRSPVFRSQLPAGKTWIRLDLSKQGASMGIDLSSLVSTSQTYAPLERGLVSTTRLGGEVVAEEPTTHYRAVVDVRRAARALPAYRKQIEALEKATGIRLARSTYDVWIDRDGWIRRMRYSMPTAAGGVRGTAASTITFRSFNRPVNIAAPPRGQVHSP